MTTWADCCGASAGPPQSVRSLERASPCFSPRARLQRRKARARLPNKAMQPTGPKRPAADGQRRWAAASCRRPDCRPSTRSQVPWLRGCATPVGLVAARRPLELGCATPARATDVWLREACMLRGCATPFGRDVARRLLEGVQARDACMPGGCATPARRVSARRPMEFRVRAHALVAPISCARQWAGRHASAVRGWPRPTRPCKRRSAR